MKIRCIAVLTLSLCFLLACRKGYFSEVESFGLSAKAENEKIKDPVLQCPEESRNLAYGKKITSSYLLRADSLNATDGIIASSNYTGLGSGLHWIQIDLGSATTIDKIRIWHYYADARTYHDVIVRISNDPTFSSGAITLFNNDMDGSAGFGIGQDAEYKENAYGKTIAFDSTTVRYVRLYSNGSTANIYNHIVEAEVWSFSTSPSPSEFMFDDFNYSTSDDPLISSHGWRIKTGTYGPGPNGSGEWYKSNITFPADPDDAANKFLRLTSSFNKETGVASQAQMNTAWKFFEGTYAARVKFSDKPDLGNDGAHVVQTFYTINTDPNAAYSELDFEYLPNGGWGDTAAHAMYTTSWYSAVPKVSRNYQDTGTSYSGWKNLVMVVAAGQVKFYIDGALVPEPTDGEPTIGPHYTPRSLMAISFNLWFADAAGKTSTYLQDVDWVYYARNSVLTTDQVLCKVSNFRATSIFFTDTVVPNK